MFLFTSFHLLASWVFVMKITSAGECSKNHVFDLIYRNSAATEVPSTERNHISKAECARQCTMLYSDNCMGFFYNTNTSSCSIYNSSVNCVTLKDQPGTKGYASVKQPPKLSECVALPDGDEIRPLNISGMNETVLGYYDSEGYLVIQRRANGSEDFNRSWVEYENGFGNLRNEFWLGNKYIHALTSQRWYELWFDLEDIYQSKAYRIYSYFSILDAANKYQLNLKQRSQVGNLGDYFFDHNGSRFCTFDTTNDTNCGPQTAGGGWWVMDYLLVFLNGQMLCSEINCCRWYRFSYNLTRTQMKMRPS